MQPAKRQALGLRWSGRLYGCRCFSLGRLRRTCGKGSKAFCNVNFTAISTSILSYFTSKIGEFHLLYSRYTLILTMVGRGQRLETKPFALTDTATA